MKRRKHPFIHIIVDRHFNISNDEWFILFNDGWKIFNKLLYTRFQPHRHTETHRHMQCNKKLLIYKDVCDMRRDEKRKSGRARGSEWDRWNKGSSTNTRYVIKYIKKFTMTICNASYSKHMNGYRIGIQIIECIFDRSGPLCRLFGWVFAL